MYPAPEARHVSSARTLLAIAAPKTWRRMGGWCIPLVAKPANSCHIRTAGSRPWAGILWQPRRFGHVNPITHTCWDWMHILVASGGVAQYHLNGYCCALVSQGIPLKTLDDFARAWVWPRSQHGLQTEFFSQRVNYATHWKPCFFSFEL